MDTGGGVVSPDEEKVDGVGEEWAEKDENVKD